jgi:hypothetical protein
MAGEAEVAKTLTVAAVTLALIAMPAHAQMGGKRVKATKKTERPERKSMRRPTRPRSKNPGSKESTIRGAACGPPSLPGSRNRRVSESGLEPPDDNE